jgi:uncharacterized membrane protein HdeD (DUF308 family)
MATYDSAPSDTDNALDLQGTDPSWIIILVGAAFTFVFGLIVVVWPHATLAVIAVLVGIQLLVFGIVRLIAGFTASGESGALRAAYVVLGLLGILAGLYFIRHLSVTVALLGILVGLYWTLHGIVDLVVAAIGGPLPGRWTRAAAGVISLAAGLIVLFKPKESLKFLLVVLGIYLMLYALVLAFGAIQLRRIARHVAATG